MKRREFLTLIAGSAFDWPVVASGSRFAYASVRNTNSIAGLRIDPISERLSRFGLFQAEASPRSFALDPDARFLICAGQDESTVGIYAIDPENGALAPTHRYPLGPNPSWVETIVLPMTP